jgi:hypothetical protein
MFIGRSTRRGAYCALWKVALCPLAYAPPAATGAPAAGPGTAAGRGTSDAVVQQALGSGDHGAPAGCMAGALPGRAAKRNALVPRRSPVQRHVAERDRGCPHQRPGAPRHRRLREGPAGRAQLHRARLRHARQGQPPLAGPRSHLRRPAPAPGAAPAIIGAASATGKTARGAGSWPARSLWSREAAIGRRAPVVSRWRHDSGPAALRPDRPPEVLPGRVPGHCLPLVQGRRAASGGARRSCPENKEIILTPGAATACYHASRPSQCPVRDDYATATAGPLVAGRERRSALRGGPPGTGAVLGATSRRPGRSCNPAVRGGPLLGSPAQVPIAQRPRPCPVSGTGFSSPERRAYCSAACRRATWAHLGPGPDQVSGP